MNKREKLAFAFVTALAMTSGGFAFGQFGDRVKLIQSIKKGFENAGQSVTYLSSL